MSGALGPLIGAVACGLTGFILWLLAYRDALKISYEFAKPTLWEVGPGDATKVFFFLAVLLLAVAVVKRLHPSAPRGET